MYCALYALRHLVGEMEWNELGTDRELANPS